MHYHTKSAEKIQFQIKEPLSEPLNIAELSEKRAQELEKQHAEHSQNRQQSSKSGALPLQREVAPPRPYPFDKLGPILGPAARRIHEVVKAPDSICGQSLLAAAALITQQFSDIHIDGRVHPLSLFFLTVAESGDRKSAVDNIVLKPIRDYERMLFQCCKKEKSDFKNRMDLWKRRRETVLKQHAEKNKQESPDQIEPEPQRPLEPFMLLEEPSYEGLIKLYAVGQPSVGLFSDEGGRMLGGYAMSKDNLLKTACGLSSLWDGKPITRIRGGDENLLLYGRRFSMHLMIQEVVLSGIFQNDILLGQGLIARCLIVAPLSNAGNRPYTAVDISQDPIIQDFYARANELFLHVSPLASPEAENEPTPSRQVKNELTPSPLYLCPDAKDSWISFHDEIDRKLKPEDDYYLIRRTANKAAEQALRIAGVLTKFEDFEAEYVSLDVMCRAIDLVRFYLEEALRLAETSFVDPDLKAAEATLRWMKGRAEKAGQKTFGLQEIYQKGPRETRSKDSAVRIIKILEEHQQIFRQDSNIFEWSLEE